MLDNFMEWIDLWGKFLTFLVGAPLTLWLITKVVAPYFRKIGRAVDMILPNGGSSIIDTMRRIEEQTLLISADQRALLHLDSRPMFKCDSSGQCIYVNRRYTDLTGLHWKDCMGEGWLRAIHQDDQHRVIGEWTHCMETGTEFRIEFRWVHQRTGKVITGTCNATITRIENRMAGAVGTIDINNTINNDNNT